MLQRYLPVYNARYKTVLGLLDLDTNIDFVGNEVNRTVGGAVITLLKVTPSVSLIRRQNPWFMAAVYTYDEYRLQQYRGNSKFLEIKDNMPYSWWSSPSVSPNYLREYKGNIIRGLEESFAT